MRIETIYRYPVKGLSPEPLEQAALNAGRPIAWDRAFALAQGDCLYDEANPAWRPKSEFLCLARNAEAAKLDSSYDDATRQLTLTAPDGATVAASPFEAIGRTALAAFIARALPEEMRGIPRFLHGDDHSFCDHDGAVISLIGLSSLAALEAAAGAARHKLRFRANLYLSGSEPWAELGWVGRTLAIGTARLRVVERINRCAATMINPETRERDANPVKELMTHFGHVDCGVFATVIAPGTIATGNVVELAG